MLKQLRNRFLGALILLGALTFSCSKQKDPAINETIVLKQGANEDIIATMVADQLVKDYMLTDVAFMNEYAIWYGNLTGAQQRARRTEVNSAVETGSEIPDPVHTASTIENYNTLQADRASQIKVKYPLLAALSNDDYASVQNRVFALVTEHLAPQQILAGGCAPGYYACSNYCRSVNAERGIVYQRCLNGCAASYFACVNSIMPIRP